MPTTPRPFRFGFGVPLGGGRDEMINAARRAEELGYSTIGIADHFMMPFAPLIALQAIADATTTIRVTMTVLDQDFRHPAVLAKELATLDVLSGGRVEVGIGAGWMRAEYEQSGIPYDKASVRIERLEEVVTILDGLFGKDAFSFEGKYFTIKDLMGLPKPVQQPRPPILIGGGGPKLLGVAARHADIIGVTARNNSTMTLDPAEFTTASLEQKLGVIQDAAGDRFEEIEFQLSLVGVTVTDDTRAGAQAVLRMFQSMIAPAGGEFPMTEDDVLESPAFLIGSVDQICDKLISLRERYGINYFTPFSPDPEALVPVIEQLKGV